MKILVKFNTSGGGDVLSMTPVLKGLRGKYSGAEIDVATSWPEIFENNTRVNRILPLTELGDDHDKVIDLAPNYASYELLGQQAAKIAEVEPFNYRPELYLKPKEVEEVGKNLLGVNFWSSRIGPKIVGIATQMSRSKWAGRNWSFEDTTKLIETLKFQRSVTVELGKDVQSTGIADIDLVNKTSKREFFSAIACLDLLITIDSLPLHVAQALRIPTIALFGSTEPIARIVDFYSVSPLMNPYLECAGCYHKKGKSNWNVCQIKVENCMKMTPELVFEAVMSEERRLINTVFYLQNWIRGKNWSL